MKKLSLVFAMVFFVLGTMLAQRTVTGNITDDTGEALIGANILVKGTNTGAVTDLDGNYTLTVPEGSTTLVVSYTGYSTQEVEIGASNVVDITMSSGVQLDELIVTALGIKRDEKSLGYAVQEVSGDQVTAVQETNVVNALSGKVAGVQVKNSQTMGGSANILIRGTTSLTGNNQPLFVVDGVPVDNSTFNEANQTTGRGGYDYGNLAGDINPDDVESISVLKGAAATALYGSRAANGVILVVTKKGKARKGLGVTYNTSLVFNTINEQTLPQHQREYGAGYGAYYEDPTGYFFQGDVDGDGQLDLIVPTSEDASWGARFDPNLNVVHWDALDPFAPNYGEKRPYVAPEHGIASFFETGTTFINSVAIDGGDDRTTFRLSYTNNDEEGILPNSELNRHLISLNGSQKLAENLRAAVSVNYVNNEALGRAGTGYDGNNVMQSFGQWFQANLDMKRLKDNYKTADGRHMSWNRTYWDTERPIYFDNPYWVRYESYNNDRRNRVYGNILLEYDINDWLSVSGRAMTDYFNDQQEERIAKQSVDIADYTKRVRESTESNFELLLKFNKRINDVVSLSGLVGGNARRNQFESTSLSTRDGLIIEGIYSISNSASSEIESAEYFAKRQQNSAFASISLGLMDMVYLDVTGRNDWSSTLPSDNNSYFYPSVSGSFVFSELEAFQGSVLSFGKLRLNYAEVGNDAAPYQTTNYYVQNNNFGSQPSFSLGATLNNPDLKPESTRSYEAGLQLNFLKNRVGFDFAWYKTNTFDQILDVSISSASGFARKVINAGDIENKGYELAIFATPVKKKNFSWDIGLNWSKNKNKVVELAEDVENYQLASHFFMTYNAAVGEPYGTFKGTNYVYHDNGEPIVGEDGFYLSSGNTSDIIGNINPDWIGGIVNDFNVYGFRIHTLLDIQKGGDFYSLNTMFGRATGIYDETAGLNDKGNPKRDPVADGGGVKLDGVDANGNPNTVYAPASDFFGVWYYRNNPTAVYILDASYVKLREVSISYELPKSIMAKIPFRSLSVGIIGRNLAILSDNVRHLDPEQALSAGNVQGFEVGTYPSTRSIGVNVKVGL